MKVFLSFIGLTVMLAAGAWAEQQALTAHVRSAAKESKSEVTPGRLGGPNGLLIYTIYTVDLNGMTYQLESADTRKPEVGKDYKVKRITDREVILLIPGKRHDNEIGFYIKAVAEKGSSK